MLKPTAPYAIRKKLITTHPERFPDISCMSSMPRYSLCMLIWSEGRAQELYAPQFLEARAQVCHFSEKGNALFQHPKKQFNKSCVHSMSRNTHRNATNNKAQALDSLVMEHQWRCFQQVFPAPTQVCFQTDLPYKDHLLRGKITRPPRSPKLRPLYLWVEIPGRTEKC